MFSELSEIIQIIFADIILSGDNALIIGMAAAGLPVHLRKKAIFIGITVICVFVGGFVIMIHRRLIRLSHGVDD